MEVHSALDLLLENVGLIITYVAAGFTAMALSKVKEWQKKKFGRKAAKKSVENNVKINNFLSEVRALTTADRLTLAQFHNGDYFASGASVQKVSVTHSVVEPGVAFPVGIGDVNVNLQQIPASFMTALLAQLFKKGYVVYHSDAGDNWVKKAQVANGSATTVMVLIPGKASGEALGILSFAWIKDHKVTKECVNTLLEYGKRISTYL